jgi:hypothetical protein
MSGDTDIFVGFLVALSMASLRSISWPCGLGGVIMSAFPHALMDFGLSFVDLGLEFCVNEAEYIPRLVGFYIGHI